MKHILVGAILLAVSGSNAATMIVVTPGAAPARVVEDFESFNPPPIEDYSGNVSINGGAMGSLFAGQTGSPAGPGEGEVVSGTPTDPLTLVGDPNSNDNVRTIFSSSTGEGVYAVGLQQVSGAVPGGFPNGAISFIFNQNLRVLGIDFIGQDQIPIDVSFFGRDGSFIDAIQIQGFVGPIASYTFSAPDAIVAGVTISDGATGVGIDNLRMIPEPPALALLGIGLIGLSLRRRSNT